MKGGPGVVVVYNFSKVNQLDKGSSTNYAMPLRWVVWWSAKKNYCSLWIASGGAKAKTMNYKGEKWWDLSMRKSRITDVVVAK